MPMLQLDERNGTEGMCLVSVVGPVASCSTPATCTPATPTPSSMVVSASRRLSPDRVKSGSRNVLRRRV
eukprot:7383335-Prymnesium_polylepis.2